MNLSKETVDVLKNFSVINSNLVIHAGKKIATVSASKDIMAEYEGVDEFEKKVSVFNMNELLGVLSAFGKPELDLSDDYVTIKEGKQKVKYVYAAESLLTTPSKSIVMPAATISFSLSSSQLERINKMAGVLAVEDMSFIGNGKKIIARVHDVKNSTGNSFDLDLEVTTTQKFDVHFKVEKMSKLFSGDYDVEISDKKISKFLNKNIKLVVYLAVEIDSTFA
jgi:hypothetical protein